MKENRLLRLCREVKQANQVLSYYFVPHLMSSIYGMIKKSEWHLLRDSLSLQTILKFHRWFSLNLTRISTEKVNSFRYWKMAIMCEHFLIFPLIWLKNTSLMFILAKRKLIDTEIQMSSQPLHYKDRLCSKFCIASYSSFTDQIKLF
jgi:hypothetical protein